MSRITKAISEDVAKQLLSSKLEEIGVLKKELKAKGTEIKLRTIPKDVLKAYNSNKSYFRTTNSEYANGVGLDRWFSISFETLPCNSQAIQLTDEEAEFLLILTDKISDKTKEYKNLKIQIETALFNLRTYNNVEKEFPEAFKLLPKLSVNTSLMIDVKKLRCKLDKSTC